ncbi:glycoside hydrolase family 43 protein [Echinicola sp. 20G]|uniref:glycoside hydrolase family 43 protein n=1 Tax=Echinicola sp. 20G TaxID=2781961 RepID=UPI001F1BEDB3|nr:glycoside hydrolase family 43 protein [Echinicola sp. 20G]
MADPTVFYYDGIYYLYGTYRADEGFQVYESTNLKEWKGPSGKLSEGFCLRKENVYGDRGFWAPQVFEKDGIFYMAYTANEHISIAKSKSPLGPFEQESQLPIGREAERKIDPFIYNAPNGKTYMYYVKVANGGNRIYVSEITPDFKGLIEESTKLCIEATNPWENFEDAEWTVTEGPSILFHKGLYYMVYSANDFRSQHYAVGYAVSDSPDGPWKKWQQPILKMEDVGVPGTGHGDFFLGEDGRMYYVFHTHFSKEQVAPRKTAIIQADFVENDKGEIVLTMNPDTWRYLEEQRK